MKTYSRILIVANLLLLIVFFNWSVFRKEQLLRQGELILFELAPADPRSLIQGDYMRLSYTEAILPDSVTNSSTTPPRGYAVLHVDSLRIAHVVRLQPAPTPLHGNERIVRYKLIRQRLFFGADAFFFEEGQDTLYQKAAYGGLKVDNKGNSLLTGLYDKELQPIAAKKKK